MGKKAGRGMGAVQVGGRILAILLALVLIAGCQVAERGKHAGKTGWVRQVEARPQQVLRCYYGPPEVIRMMIDELGDVAVPVRGLSRFGNGAVAAGFKDERGRWLRGVECGGVLLVEGTEDQVYRLVVENRTDSLLELLPSVDGLDLESGMALDLNTPGRQVPPRATTLFSFINGPDVKAGPLKFRAISGPQAIHQISSKGTLGSVQVAVFLAEGADTFQARPPLARRNKARTFPQRHHEPLLLPYQYR